jgi:hypothetical protein
VHKPVLFDLGLILMRSHDGDDIQAAMIQSERCSDLAQVCATLEPRAKERRIYERVFFLIRACLLPSFHTSICLLFVV